MRILLEKICFYIWFHFITRIKAWWRYHVLNIYIEDTPRNEQVIEFCNKIIEDNNYQPSNPVEHWLELQWEDIYKQEAENAANENQKILPYEQCRIEYAAQMVLEIAEFMIVKDR